MFSPQSFNRYDLLGCFIARVVHNVATNLGGGVDMALRHTFEYFFDVVAVPIFALVRRNMANIRSPSHNKVAARDCGAQTLISLYVKDAIRFFANNVQIPVQKKGEKFYAMVPRICHPASVLRADGTVDTSAQADVEVLVRNWSRGNGLLIHTEMMSQIFTSPFEACIMHMHDHLHVAYTGSG